MKILLIFLLMALGTVAMARPANAPTQRTRIADDNTTLTIRIDRENGMQPVHYQHVFNISNMNWIEKDLLKIHVFADQGVAIPFHEIAELVVLVVGILALVTSLLIVNYQASKRPTLTSN